MTKLINLFIFFTNFNYQKGVLRSLSIKIV